MTQETNDIRFPIYLDNHATTQVDPRVVDAMLPYFTQHYGNASSHDHRFGWHAGESVERARRTIAQSIGAESSEIIFTSGATESNNLALKGIAESYRDKGTHIVTCATEHRSVLDVCHTLEACGFRITVLSVNNVGQIDQEEFKRALTPETILVSVMVANNEIGTIAPISEIGTACRERRIIFHTDASQAYGKIMIDCKAMNIDAMSFSAHKIYGPKGVGCLFVRRQSGTVRLIPQTDGGGQEYGLRSGTLNVAGIVGFGEAARLAILHSEEENRRTALLRDRLQTLLTLERNVCVNGDETHRLPNNLNISLNGNSAVSMLSSLREIAVSTGAACASVDNDTEKYSHVLRAIGVGREQARSTIRFGLGRFTTQSEVEYAGARIINSLHDQRSVSVWGDSSLERR